MRKAAASAFEAAHPGYQRVLLVRHGEAEHNVNWALHRDTPDTRLTARGLQQADALSHVSAFAECTLLVVSPLSRAVETASAIFGERPACRTCLCALHSERRSNGSDVCNQGSPPANLAARFPFVRAWEGFDELPDRWWPEAASDANNSWRATRLPTFLAWLAAQPQAKVVVVGHGAYFSDPRMAGRMLSNCEIAVMRGAAGGAR